MTPIFGFSHVAVNTADLDRYLRFYCDVVGLDHQVTVKMHHPPHVRHAVVAVAPGSVLHAFEMPDYDPEADGIPNEMFRRGRIDHFGLMVADMGALEAVRDRLVAAGASDGQIAPLGPVHAVHFVDPDGLHGEINCPNLTFDISADDVVTVEAVGNPDWLTHISAGLPTHSSTADPVTA